jgi:SsrA-binding protein
MGSDISVNRKALRDFHVHQRLEAGIQLKGTEVKSIRAGFANVTNAFAKVEKRQVWAYDIDIKAYEKASHTTHAPKQVRRLLLHRAEIDKLEALTRIEGFSIVVLRMYWKEAHVKIELGVGKGKLAGDKRHDLKEKAEKREAERERSRYNESHKG